MRSVRRYRSSRRAGRKSLGRAGKRSMRRAGRRAGRRSMRKSMRRAGRRTRRRSMRGGSGTTEGDSRSKMEIFTEACTKIPTFENKNEHEKNEFINETIKSINQVKEQEQEVETEER